MTNMEIVRSFGGSTAGDQECIEHALEVMDAFPDERMHLEGWLELKEQILLNARLLKFAGALLKKQAECVTGLADAFDKISPMALSPDRFTIEPQNMNTNPTEPSHTPCHACHCHC